MTKINIEVQYCISLQEWNRVVEEVYGRPYNFQQQDGSKDRGQEVITVSDSSDDNEFYDFKNDTVPEIVNHGKMGVSFKAWLARDPQQSLDDSELGTDQYAIRLWWLRNFYPSVDVIANDLCKKGFLKPGQYIIIIDW